MTDGFIQLPVDSSGKKLVTADLGASGHRQQIVVADPTTLAAEAAVINGSPAGTEYGLMVRGYVRTGLDPEIGGLPVTTKFTQINASASGDNTIIAAVTSKKLRVLSLSLMAAGTVNARWASGTGTSTPLSGLLPLVANSGYSNNSPFGLFETAAGSLLNLNLSGAVAVTGHLSYVEI